MCYNKNFLNEIRRYIKSMTFKNLINMKNQIVIEDF